MQPYLFPYIGYYQLMHAVDRFVVADDVTFIKQGWINRNRLLINGSAAYFTVPLQAAPGRRADPGRRDRRQPGSSRWRGTLLKTIANFYRRAPSFDRGLSARRTRDRRSVHAHRRHGTGEPARSVSIISALPVVDRRFVGGLRQRASEGAGSRHRHLPRRARQRLRQRDRRAGAVLARGISRARHPPAFPQQRARSSTRQFTTPFVPSLSVIDLLMFNRPERRASC